MKKSVLYLCACIALTFLFTSCQKENLKTSEVRKNPYPISGKINSIGINSLFSTGTTQPVTCGTPLQVNLVDNYPTQFYQTYGNITVSNDATNVYVTLNSLTTYNFYFTKIMLSVGNLAHLQSVVPYFDYLTGPPSADYTQNFSTGVASYTFTIPRSTLNLSCFNIFIWAVEVKSDNSDFHDVWVSSTTQVNGNPNSSYINYCVQSCTTGGNTGGGNGDDDDHDGHHGKDKGHDKDHHDNDHHDNDNHNNGHYNDRD